MGCIFFPCTTVKCQHSFTVGMQSSSSFTKPRRNVVHVDRQRTSHPLRGHLLPFIGVGVAFGQVLRQHGFFCE